MSLRPFTPREADPYSLASIMYGSLGRVILPKRSATFQTPLKPAGRQKPGHTDTEPTNQSNQSVQTCSPTIQSLHHPAEQDTESPVFPIDLSPPSGDQLISVINKSLRKCAVCKLPVKGHKGPYGKNKCQNKKVNLLTFLESNEATPVTREPYVSPPGSNASDEGDYICTPPPIEMPREVCITPPPPYIDTELNLDDFLPQDSTSFKDLNPIKDNLLLSQTIAAEHEPIPRKKNIKKNATKDEKKPGKNSRAAVYFGPLMKNMFSTSNLIQPTFVRPSSSSRSVEQDLQEEAVDERSRSRDGVFSGDSSSDERSSQDQERSRKERFSDLSTSRPGPTMSSDSYRVVVSHTPVTSSQLDVTSTPATANSFKRPRKMCDDDTCLSCRIEVNCHTCDSCINPGKKLKCFFR